MSKLNFDITVNSSDFIEKTEQMRSAIRATALEIEQQGKNMESSFQQMADSAGLTAHFMGSMVADMHLQINDAIASLTKIDLGNQLQLSKLQKASAKNDDGILSSGYSQNEAIQAETNARESLSVDIQNQYSELAQLNEQLTKVSNPNAGFEGAISGLEGISGACSAATGMMELFSAENEYLQEIMQKVQSALTVVNGLQEVSMMLNKDSAFQVNVLGKLKLWWRTITLQAAAAQGVETAASSTGTVANLGLAGSFRAVGLAIQSIPVFGWILAGISALIGAYSLWSSRTKGQQEEQDHLNKSIMDFNDSVGNYAAKPIVLIESLSTKFKALGSDIDAQKKFIDDNKKSFDELGISIQSVKDAQQLLVDNKQEFINAQMAKAISLAYTEQMQEVAKKYSSAQRTADVWQNKVDERRAKDNANSTVVTSSGKEFVLPRNIPKYTKSELDVLKERQMLPDDNETLYYDEGKLKEALKIADVFKQEMEDLARKAYSYTLLSDNIMSKFSPKSLPEKNNGAQNNKANTLHGDQQALIDIYDRETLEQIRATEDSENKKAQVKVDKMAEGSQKILAQMKLNHDKEQRELTREREDALLKQIEDAKAAFDEHEKNELAKNSTYQKKTFNAADIKLTGSENRRFDKLETNLKTNQDEEIKKYYKNLLESYKGYTDQRLAIEQKYNGDIASLEDARSEFLLKGDLEKAQQADSGIAQATKNKGKELMGHDYEQLKKSPEYVRAFENLKNTSSETLNSLLNQLEGAKQKAAKVLSPDQLKDYTTAIQNVMTELDQRNPFQALSNKKTELAYAEEELARAQEELNVANEQAKNVKDGGKIEVTSTQYNAKTGKIDTVKSYQTEAQALANVTAKTENLSAAKDKVTEKSGNVKEAEKKVKEQIDGLSKSISALGASIDGPAGEIISLIGDIGSFTMMAMSGVKAAADTSAQAISTVEKASVILAIISAAVQIATKITSLFISKDGEQYEAMKSSYESLVKVWDALIDRKMEYISIKTGEEATKASEEALVTLRKQIEATKQLATERLKVTNGSHSMEYRMWQGSYSFNGNTWNDVAGEIESHTGRSINSMRDFTNMTAEELIWVQENYSGLWARMDGEFKEQLDSLIEYKNKELEIINATNQSLTQTTFDSVRDNFLDALSDMDSTSEDFANNFSSYMQKAIINTMLAKNYEKRLNDWYQAFAEANKKGGIDESEYANLQNDWDRMVSEALEERDALMEQFGWTSENDSSQSSTQKGFAAMSQDTGEELNGRFTALQISNEEIRNSMIYVLGNMSILSSNATDRNVLLTEMRNLAVMSNGHLEDIAKHTKVLLGFGDKLDNIDRNTQKI